MCSAYPRTSKPMKRNSSKMSRLGRALVFFAIALPAAHVFARVEPFDTSCAQYESSVCALNGRGTFCRPCSPNTYYVCASDLKATVLSCPEGEPRAPGMHAPALPVVGFIAPVTRWDGCNKRFDDQVSVRTAPERRKSGSCHPCRCSHKAPSPCRHGFRPRSGVLQRFLPGESAVHTRCGTSGLHRPAACAGCTTAARRDRGAAQPAPAMTKR